MEERLTGERVNAVTDALARFCARKGYGPAVRSIALRAALEALRGGRTAARAITDGKQVAKEANRHKGTF